MTFRQLRLTHSAEIGYWPHDNHRQKAGRCWLRLYEDRYGAVAIVTELADNPGMSITNAIEGVRKQIERIGLATGPITLVEHYSDLVSYGQRQSRNADRYSTVTFDERGVPSWHPLEYGDLLELLDGVGLEDLPDHLYQPA